MLKIINTKKIRGFTLVEMLVSVSIFMIVMTVAVGSLVAIIDANRKAQAIKNVVNNINFALESISKDMRVGTKYHCYLESGGDNSIVSDCTGEGGIGVKYLSGEGKTVHYVFKATATDAEGNIQRCKKDNYGDSCLPTDWESLTAPTDNVKITNMKFYVIGSDTNDLKQPRVIITIEGTAGIKESLKTNFNIQTTVSQRIREM